MRRFIWNWLARPLFRCSPHPAYGLRRFLLRLCGAQLGQRVRCRRSVDIDQPWNVRFDDLVMVSDGVLIRSECPVHVGSRCVISQYCTLVTVAGDELHADRPPVRAPIHIAEDCWVATDTLVLPGATLEAGVVVGARGMVSGRIGAWQIATGEPARPRRERVLHAST